MKSLIKVQPLFQPFTWMLPPSSHVLLKSDYYSPVIYSKAAKVISTIHGVKLIQTDDTNEAEIHNRQKVQD